MRLLGLVLITMLAVLVVRPSDAMRMPKGWGKSHNHKTHKAPAHFKLGGSK